MKVEDLRPRGAGWTVHAMPCHHALAEALRAFIDAAGIAEDRKGWLLRTARGHKADALSERAMNLSDAWCVIRRRAAAAGITAEIGCHTFRATGITAYLANGGALSTPLAELPAGDGLVECGVELLRSKRLAKRTASGAAFDSTAKSRSDRLVTSSASPVAKLLISASSARFVPMISVHSDPAGRLRWSVDEALRGVQHQQRGVLAALAGAGRADGHQITALRRPW
jgi:hypothetical protein